MWKNRGVHWIIHGRWTACKFALTKTIIIQQLSTGLHLSYPNWPCISHIKLEKKWWDSLRQLTPSDHFGFYVMILGAKTRGPELFAMAHQAESQEQQRFHRFSRRKMWILTGCLVGETPKIHSNKMRWLEGSGPWDIALCSEWSYLRVFHHGFFSANNRRTSSWPPQIS